ncbi:MAG TPA: hypothetical protein VHI51_11365 [Ktedonobacterales bacterium]|nr:hypothetical protein [Ktedonobacterales bacterium]
MKIVTYLPKDAPAHSEGRAGLLRDDAILDLAALGAWAAHNGVAAGAKLPDSTLALLRLGPVGMDLAREALALAAKARPEDLRGEAGLLHDLSATRLRSPVPEPPSVRDFYAFEQHVKAARAKRGVGMIPEWYEIPVSTSPTPLPSMAPRRTSLIRASARSWTSSWR